MIPTQRDSNRNFLQKFLFQKWRIKAIEAK